MISIVIPVYNREHLILETLKSITSQKFEDFECIVVDDGSTDATVELVSNFCKKDSRFRLIERAINEPKGAPSCRNIGLANASGEFIQFFDSDDILLPSALSDKLKVLISSEGAQFVVSKTAFLIEDGSLKLPDQRLTFPSSFEAFLKNKTSFYTPGPLFRSEFLRSNKKAFEVGLKRHQEWEYYCRLMASMPKFEIIDKVHCHYRMHSDNIKSESDRLGNLYYRGTKLVAISYMNKNSNYSQAKAIKNSFWPYGITTLKVAVYNFNLIATFKTLFWLASTYLNTFRRASK